VEKVREGSRGFDRVRGGSRRCEELKKVLNGSKSRGTVRAVAVYVAGARRVEDLIAWQICEEVKEGVSLMETKNCLKDGVKRIR
jgi:hypothetical protein